MEQTKKLLEMTKEELWQLFPIFLTEHNPELAVWYEEEIAYLKGILPPYVEYYHIGSTAIKGIWAKPIVDILIVVKAKAQLQTIAEKLRQNGYILMSKAENRISLNKGYTENGFADRVFHLHLRFENDIDEVYFRDYLNAHPKVAKEYEVLKLQLWKRFEHNRDGYTEAKTEFVKKYTTIAKNNL